MNVSHELIVSTQMDVDNQDNSQRRELYRELNFAEDDETRLEDLQKINFNFILTVELRHLFDTYLAL